jgi:hypothetical protein
LIKKYKNVLDEAHGTVEGEVCINNHPKDAAKTIYALKRS